MRAFFRSGDPFIWLAGSALAGCLLMIAGLVTVVVVNGLGFFWPSALMRIQALDGTVVYGEVIERQQVPDEDGAHRLQLKIGNRDVYGLDFRWIDESDIETRS